MKSIQLIRFSRKPGLTFPQYTEIRKKISPSRSKQRLYVVYTVGSRVGDINVATESRKMGIGKAEILGRVGDIRLYVVKHSASGVMCCNGRYLDGELSTRAVLKAD